MLPNPALRLVDKFGSRSEVAKHFEISREAIRLWLKNGIPPDRALEVEELMGGKIKAQDILRYARQQKRAA